MASWENKSSPVSTEDSLEDRLTNMPREIHNLMLSFCLMDPLDFSYTTDRFSTNRLFTQPILQTCRKLRQTCLDFINAGYIWIVIQFSSLSSSRRFRKDPIMRTLPLLSPSFRRYITQDAAKIYMGFSRSEDVEPRPQSLRAQDVTFIFPFSFENLLRMLGRFGVVDGWNRRDSNLKIESHNVIGRVEKQATDLVFPTLLILRGFKEVCFEHNGQKLDVKETKMLNITGKWNPGALLRKAESVCHHADVLQAKGYKDEADILLLRSYWITRKTAIWLSRAYYEWCFEHDLGDKEVITVNRLRSRIHHIEHQACLAYVRFATKHGQRHLRQLTMDSFHPNSRFLVARNGIGYGLTPVELSELHHGRALFHQHFGQAHHEGNLQLAFIEMFFALMLRPGSDMLQDHLKQLRVQLGRRLTDTTEELCRLRMSVIFDASSPHGPQRVLWGGDYDLFINWDGPRMSQLMPLTRKGREDSPTFADWWTEFQAHPQSTAGCSPTLIMYHAQH